MRRAVSEVPGPCPALPDPLLCPGRKGRCRRHRGQMGRTMVPTAQGQGPSAPRQPACHSVCQPGAGGGRRPIFKPWELPRLDRFAESSIPGPQYSTAGFIAEWSLALRGLQATAFLTRPSPSTAFARVLSATERPAGGAGRPRAPRETLTDWKTLRWAAAAGPAGAACCSRRPLVVTLQTADGALSEPPGAGSAHRPSRCRVRGADPALSTSRPHAQA